MPEPRRKPLIVLTSEIHREVIREKLLPRARVLVVPTRTARGRRKLERALGEADALIALNTDPVPESLLALAPRLRVVGNYAVGVNNIDLEACVRRKIAVVNTPGVLTRATAELTLALLLAAARRIPEGERICRANRFPGWAPDYLLGQELKGRTAVLVGRGRIGSETGRLFRALGIRVLWITRRDSDVTLRAKLAKAQILSLHVPLTPETRHWLDARRIACLPRDAIVLNTTRGAVIDERALIAALKERRIFSAGLDVFEREPEIPAELRRLPNVVLLPHLGSATAETRRAMAELVCEGVLGILSGKRPWNQVRSVR